MQVGGASANIVVRAEEPSSAGQAVGPEIDAPGSTAAGVMPVLAIVVAEVFAVVDVGDDLDESDCVAPKKAPNVESTTTITITSATRRWRRLVWAWLEALACLARSRACSRFRRFGVVAIRREPTSDSG